MPRAEKTTKNNPSAIDTRMPKGKRAAQETTGTGTAAEKTPSAKSTTTGTKAQPSKKGVKRGPKNGQSGKNGTAASQKQAKTARKTADIEQTKSHESPALDDQYSNQGLVGTIRGRDAVFKLNGFEVLLGWHFLIIFSPLFPAGSTDMLGGFLFDRQVVLYTSLAIGFLLCDALRKLVFPTKRPFPRRTYINLIAVGAVATIATFCSVYFRTAGLATAGTVATVFLGLTEAVLIEEWFHYYTRISESDSNRHIALQQAIGACLCFFVRNLSFDLALVVAAILPIASAYLLAKNYQAYTNSGPLDIDIDSEPIPEQELQQARKYFVSGIIPAIIFGLVFGFLQGNYIKDGTVLLGVVDPITILGAAVAGLIIFFSFKKYGNRAGIIAILIVSLLAFTCGALGMPFSASSNWALNTFFETCIMMGFNLIDFGLLVFTIGITQGFRMSPIRYIAVNRATVYFSLVVGLILGYVMVSIYGGYDQYTFISNSICVGVLVAVLLIFLGTNLTWSVGSFDGMWESPQIATTTNKSDGPDGEEQPLRGATPWRKRCTAIAEQYKLSPRETEIFFYMAKGRNAEYIQQKLWVSTHTVKTHIANIHKKLDVHSFQEMLDLIESYDLMGAADANDENRRR